jgi:hypothetical protein
VAASATFSWADSETFGSRRRARETVQMDSPDNAATSWMVTRGALAMQHGLSPFFSWEYWARYMAEEECKRLQI